MELSNYIIIDDDPNSIYLIQQYLKADISFNEIGAFLCPIKALQNLSSLSPDLIFLDIDMPKLSGIELIKQLDEDYNIILTTGRDDLALESYEYDVIDYLLKPIKEARFSKAIIKYREKMGYRLSKNNIKMAERINGTNTIYIKQDYKSIQIPLNKILYLESDKEYVKIFTQNRVFRTKQRLSYFEKRLSDYSFLRIHRSFIVPTDKISSYNSTEIKVENKKLPVGRTYQKVLANFQATT